MIAIPVLGWSLLFFKIGALIAGREIARIVKRIINILIFLLMLSGKEKKSDIYNTRKYPMKKTKIASITVLP